MTWWWLTLARYGLAQARGLAVILLLMLLGVGLGLLAPWPLKLIVDHVVPQEPLPASASWLGRLPGASSPQGLLAWLAAATVGLFLAKRLAAILQGYIQSGVGNRMVYRLAADLFDHLQRRSLLFHCNRKVGDLVRRVTADTACVRELVLSVLVPLLTSLVTLASMFFIMWGLHRALALFALALTVPLAVVIRRFASRIADRKHQVWEIQGELTSLAEQTLSALPVVQAFGRENWEEERFRQLSKSAIQANLRSDLVQRQFQVSAGSVSAAATAVVMTVGAFAVLQGELTVGSLLVVISYFAALYAPIETIAYLSEGYASASAGARRVLEAFEICKGGVVDSPDAEPLPEDAAATGVAVSLEGVTFGYEQGRPALEDISLAAQPGEVVALVGATGAGKSTLISMITRFYDPWSGVVRIAGRDARQIKLESLRRHIAIVPQEPFLLPLTVAENIAYGRPEASREEVVAAAVAAEAHGFIQRLPAGYDTVIGERGATLSGGERQRLSIARALLKDAPILILDEPTSALDAETESALMQALARLTQGRTTFIIAHRLSTIRGADQIVMLDAGRVVERGSHEELMSQRGPYYRLVQWQMAPPSRAVAGQVDETILSSPMEASPSA